MARVKVYRGINVTKGEVYHGTSTNVEKRKNGSHCKGGTKALQHWSCETDKIIWKELSQHNKQKNASKLAHKLEDEYKHHRNFKNIKTAGK